MKVRHFKPLNFNFMFKNQKQKWNHLQQIDNDVTNPEEISTRKEIIEHILIYYSINGLITNCDSLKYALNFKLKHIHT